MDTKVVSDLYAWSKDLESSSDVLQREIRVIAQGLLRVIQSESDRGLYIGMSGGLRRRFKEHQSGDSQSTKGRRPWKLNYYEAYLEKQDAAGREVFLKSGGGRIFCRLG